MAWTTLAWIPNRPLYKALPDNGGADTGYTAGAIDMTGNVLLYHMDEGSWDGTSGEVLDGSVSGYNGKSVGTANTSSTAQLGRSGDLTDGYIDTEIDDPLDITGDITISAWIYKRSNGSTMLIASNTGSSGPGSYHFGMVSTDELTFWSRSSGGVSTGVTGLDRVSLNEWHHVAVTRDTSDATIRLYIDGVQDFSGAQSYIADNVAASTLTTVIGARAGGSLRFDGLIDELGIWTRKFDDTEILNLYRRGARQLKFQVRSCDDDACAGEDFEGPDGTTSTYYSELTSPSLGLPSKTLTNVDDNRYFQYKAYLDSSDGTIYSPEFTSVTIGPTHYDAGNPTIQPTSASEALYGIEGFSETLGGSNEGTVKYQISPDGTNWYYHNGSTWATASGYAQTNTAAEVNTNAEAAETVLTSGSFYFKAFLNSNLGTQQVELDAVTITTKEGGKKRDVIAPEGVKNPQIELTEDHHVRISWTNPDDTDLDRIVILRGEDPDPVSGDPIALLNKNVIEFVDITVEEGKSYTYIIATEDGSKARNRGMSKELKITVGDQPVIEEVSEETIEEISPVEIELPVAYTEEEMLEFMNENIEELMTNRLRELQLENKLMDFFSNIGMGKFMKEPENEITKIETATTILKDINPNIDIESVSTLVEGFGGPEKLKDIEKGSWYYDAVNELIDDCTISGHADGTFKPENKVLQAEFVKMLTTTSCDEDDVTSKITIFENIDDSKWYYKAYSLFKQRVEPDIELIAPGTPQKRSGLAYILYLYNKGEDSGYTSSELPFIDVPKTHKHYEAIAWAYHNGIFKDSSDKKLRPDDFVIRAEAATIIHRSRR